MPESTLTDDLLTCWQDIAYSTAARHKKLRWLLAGSGPLGTDDPPPNRAVLLDRWTGDSLLTQDKLAGFTLTAEQARDWNLGNQPANGSAAEYLTGGSSISVRESSLGRLAVLICEDLNQSARWERELIECGISHLLVPIFAKPIMQYGWQRHAAERQIDNLGAWLIIANSRVVQQAMNPALTDSEGHTCLIAGPSGPSRSSYTYDLQFGTATTGDDLGQTLVNGEYKLPTIRTAMIYDKWLGNGSRPSPP
jgi:predicted amidohydrolase